MEVMEIFSVENWASQVLGAEELVLVDFEAPWCDPESIQNEALEKFGKEWRKWIRMGRVDAALFNGLIFQYQIQEFPTLGLFQVGNLVKTFVGPGRLEKMKDWLLEQEGENERQAS